MSETIVYNERCAECPFCNVGDKSKRGVFYIVKEIIGDPNIIPNRARREEYVCGVGEKNCSVAVSHNRNRQSEPILDGGR